MTQLAVHIGAELLAAWLVTLILAAAVGYLLCGCTAARLRRRASRAKKEELK